MAKNLSILAVLAIIVALPFVFRRAAPQGDWREGDPVIVIVSPHNEAIRYEFAQAFSRWHKEKYGKPVKIDWRNIGGTTEISRYLASMYTASAQAWCRTNKMPWSANMTDALTAPAPPADAQAREIWEAYRKIDDPTQITSGIDLFFGGGQFDHAGAFAAGFSVPIRKQLPDELFKQGDVDRIPEKLSGEVWRTDSSMGNALSTFGIIYNVDRLKDLGITKPPAQWDDLADYRYFRQVGLADPTKSGSIAKAFEMLVHQKMHDAVRDAGFSDAQIAENEKRIGDYMKTKGKAYARGDVPDDLKGYQAALEQGFLDGLGLIQKIGANARYFTDSASKVPIDVSMGDATVGMAIDFYGRFQAQAAHGPDGVERMNYVTPIGGTSVSCDPISLLRGAGGHAKKDQQAETREVALRFIQFVLSDEGQRLWCYAPGTKDDAGKLIGPEKYALQRLPIARTFYPSTQPAIQSIAAEHAKHFASDLTDPTVDPYRVAEQFIYYPRWTGEHFNILRDLVRVMCIDSGDELKEAWSAIHSRADYPELSPPLGPMPTVRMKPKTAPGQSAMEEDVPLTWRTAPDIRKRFDNLDYMRAWTAAFRDQYHRIATGELHGAAKGWLGMNTGGAPVPRGSIRGMGASPMSSHFAPIPRAGEACLAPTNELATLESAAVH